MKTLIVYASKYGCTAKCAELISKRLNQKTCLYDVKNHKDIDLRQFSSIIIGGSIYMGRIQKDISDFCKNNFNILSSCKLGLFVCCMRDGKIAEQELNDGFPEKLLEKAVAVDYFGGEFLFDKMNLLDRIIAKKVSKMNQNISSLDMNKIEEFAKRMNNTQ